MDGILYEQIARSAREACFLDWDCYADVSICGLQARRAFVAHLEYFGVKMLLLYEMHVHGSKRRVVRRPSFPDFFVSSLCSTALH